MVIEAEGCMGRDVPAIIVSLQDRRRYRDKVRRCLDVLARMLQQSRFKEAPQQVGLEVEFYLLDQAGRAAMRNDEVLAAIASPAWAPELGKFNLEVALAPRSLVDDALAGLERYLADSLAYGNAQAGTLGTRLAMIGTLPTLREADVGSGSMSPNPRFRLLNEQVVEARGEEMRICIEGPEQLLTYVDSIMPEAACTSIQMHLQVSPDMFGSYWNAAQAIAAVQVALAANSPYLFGRELWRETRIPLFLQATDTRPDELAVQGVRPRVWFGEQWITSVFDLFEENLRYFPALLPLCEDDDPVADLDSGSTPELAELALHNGTVWRWNRPVYAVDDGEPHLRIENRVLPSGPTVTDVIANAAFYYGLVQALAEAERPIWTEMPFAAAHANLTEAARHGIEASIYWPGLGEVAVTELTLRRLLPLAREGLRRCQVDQPHADRMLDVIEQRCLTVRTGATWQVDMVHALQDKDGLGREAAMLAMTERYLALMHAGDPVHSWPVG